MTKAMKIFGLMLFILVAYMACDMENELNRTERIIQMMDEDTYYHTWQTLEDSLQRNPTRDEIANYYYQQNQKQ